MPIFGNNSNRRAANKRTILGAIDEDRNSFQNDYQFLSIGSDISGVVQCGKKFGNDFDVPMDLDGSKHDAVAILLEDLEKGVKQHQESIAIKACQALTEQQEAYFLSMTKLGKSMKNMTIRDFNKKYMGGDDIVNLVQSFFLDSDYTSSKKKNILSDADNTRIDMETPSRNIRYKTLDSTPVTISRASRRGEALYSVNGSPIDESKEGDLVATVSKKRRGFNDTAIIDINVGEGLYISLSDPKTLDQLDNEMKSTAMSQLKILQEQMASLMAKLVN